MNKTTALSIGIIFAFVKILSIVLAFSVLHNLFGMGKKSEARIERGNRVYIGFQALTVCPFLPYVCGVCFRNPDLIFPLVIASIYNGIVSIAFIGVYGYYCYYYPDISHDIFVRGIFDPKPVGLYLISVCAVDIGTFIGTFLYWKGFEKFDKKVDRKYNKYAFERFGLQT